MYYPELMSNPCHVFASLRYRPEKTLQTTTTAFQQAFDIENVRLKEEFKGKGIWGSDSNDSWIMIFERFSVHADARGKGWGTKLVTRVLNEAVKRARAAGKAIIVLTMPSYIKKELAAQTKNLSAPEKQKWRVQSKRVAMAFWRTMGFVRLGETLLFAWRRSMEPSLVLKVVADKAALDEDAEIDHRKGYWDLLVSR